MDCDVLFTVLFWAAGLSLFFWVGLLLAGLVGEITDDQATASRDDPGEALNERNVPV